MQDLILEIINQYGYFGIFPIDHHRKRFPADTIGDYSYLWGILDFHIPP